MGGSITVYTLGARGVVLDKSPIHSVDGELLNAQNWQVDAVGGRGGIRRRDGLAPINAAPLAGPVLGGIGVPLPDRALLQRVFYLPLNSATGPTFKVSIDGVTWVDSLIPSAAVREVTLGLDGSLPFGDAAMRWRGGDVLYYPGDDYDAAGLPSIHAWDGQLDVVVARIPINSHVTPGTPGAFGVTSLRAWGDGQLLVTVADRNVAISGQGGRMRLLLLDLRDGSLAVLGPDTDLTAGHVIGGIVEWQGRIWMAGVNSGPGGAINTYWIRPGDPSWTLDDSFSTVHGYCTGLAVFRGDLYQASAADAGTAAVIRRRGHSAGLGVLTTVAGGSTTVQGGSTTVAGGAGTAVVGGANVPNPTGPETIGSGTGVLGSLVVGGAYQFAYSYLTTAGLPTSAHLYETLLSPAVGAVADASGMVYMNVPASADARVVATAFYRTVAGGSTFYLCGWQNSNGVPFSPSFAPSGAGETDAALVAGGILAPTVNNTPHADLAIGVTSIPITDTAAFAIAAGSATVGGNTIAYTGRSTSSGPGSLTGVTGVTIAIPAGTLITLIVPIGAANLPVADTSVFLASAGSATVGGNTIAYTGRSTSSGPGTLTGVTGITLAIPAGTAIAIIIPIGAVNLPVADTSAFLLAAGAANIAGQAITYTGRSTTSGPGVLSGVAGIASAVLVGSIVTVAVLPGATSIPVVETGAFLAGGGTIHIAGQAITYTGRSTTSGPGALTGVAGVVTAIAGGAAIVPAVAAGVWTVVYTSDGTGAGNYLGPFIVTADGLTVLCFQNSVNGAAPIVRILKSLDGLTWALEYSIGATGGRSGFPIRDDNGDIYWPLASGAAQQSGSVLKRTAAGVWSVVLTAPTIRGPIGTVRQLL